MHGVYLEGKTCVRHSTKKLHVNAPPSSCRCTIRIVQVCRMPRSPWPAMDVMIARRQVKRRPAQRSRVVVLLKQRRASRAQCDPGDHTAPSLAIGINMHKLAVPAAHEPPPPHVAMFGGGRGRKRSHGSHSRPANALDRTALARASTRKRNGGRRRRIGFGRP